MTQADFQALTQNQLMTQVDSPGIESVLTHDSKCFPIFQFKSTLDLSEKHSILSRLMIRLWVIPMSVRNGYYLTRSADCYIKACSRNITEYNLTYSIIRNYVIDSEEKVMIYRFSIKAGVCYCFCFLITPTICYYCFFYIFVFFFNMILFLQKKFIRI